MIWVWMQTENIPILLGVEKLMKYANLFRLNEKSGLEITEVSPTMSTSDALRTSIGQSDLSVTTSQLARYVTTIASRGTSYELSLLDKVTDSQGRGNRGLHSGSQRRYGRCRLYLDNCASRYAGSCPKQCFFKLSRHFRCR